jgi:hypothetical protein
MILDYYLYYGLIRMYSFTFFNPNEVLVTSLSSKIDESSIKLWSPKAKFFANRGIASSKSTKATRIKKLNKALIEYLEFWYSERSAVEFVTEMVIAVNRYNPDALDLVNILVTGAKRRKSQREILSFAKIGVRKKTYNGVRNRKIG